MHICTSGAVSCYFVLIYNAYLSYLSRRNHRKLAFVGISGGYTGEKESYRADAVSNVFLLVYFELFHKLLAHHRAAIFRWVFVSFCLNTPHGELFKNIFQSFSAFPVHRPQSTPTLGSFITVEMDHAPLWVLLLCLASAV